uniref:ARAD1C34056p n=1 Tax=Blastobotrys adeninivorans TaxID=409370 RepID=A0A060T3J9_BLAAD
MYPATTASASPCTLIPVQCGCGWMVHPRCLNRHKAQCQALQLSDPALAVNGDHQPARLLAYVGAQRQWDKLAYLVSHVDQFSTQSKRWKDMTTLANIVHEHLCRHIGKYATPSPDDLRWLLAILVVNAFTWQDCFLNRLGMAFDPIFSLINHSCTPNCMAYIEGGVLRVVAIRSLAKGDHLDVAYFNPQFPIPIRQAVLQRQYCFQCSCLACVSGLSPADTVQCPACTKLLIASSPNCSECGTRIDGARALDIAESVQVSLASSLPVKGQKNPLKEEMSRYLVSLRILLAQPCLPFTREPVYSVLETLRKRYEEQGDYETAFVIGMVICGAIIAPIELYSKNRVSPLMLYSSLSVVCTGIDALRGSPVSEIHCIVKYLLQFCRIHSKRLHCKMLKSVSKRAYYQLARESLVAHEQDELISLQAALSSISSRFQHTIFNRAISWDALMSFLLYSPS